MLSKALLPWPAEELTTYECAQLAETSPALAMSHGELFAGAIPQQARDAYSWLDLIVAPDETLGNNIELRPTFYSPLALAPILRVGENYLVASLHSLTSDLSGLLEEKLKRRFGQVYYRCRSQELENAALANLKKLMPDAQAIAGGHYWIRDKGETIQVDGVVLWNDVCFVVESKSGYLTSSARHGSESAVLADLQKTIGDGVFQACRLLMTLQEKKKVTLNNRTGGRLVLDTDCIRRAYVIIPTADRIGAITTTLERLWRNDVIPKRSLPFVIPVQDLGLMADLLLTGLNFVAYLDFREEILANENLMITDELELLGAFVSGEDVLGRIHLLTRQYSTQMQQSAWRRKHHFFHIDGDKQDTHINPWVRAVSQALTMNATPPPPPKRHGEVERQHIDSMFAASKNLHAASLVMQVDREVLTRLIAERGAPRKNSEILRTSPCSTGAVYLAPSVRLSQVRRKIRALRSESRHVLYLQQTSTGRRIRYAEYGRQHTFYSLEHSILAASKTGAVSIGHDDTMLRDQLIEDLDRFPPA
jgi:hypothetical protein